MQSLQANRAQGCFDTSYLCFKLQHRTFFQENDDNVATARYNTAVESVPSGFLSSVIAGIREQEEDVTKPNNNPSEDANPVPSSEEEADDKKETQQQTADAARTPPPGNRDANKTPTRNDAESDVAAEVDMKKDTGAADSVVVRCDPELFTPPPDKRYSERYRSLTPSPIPPVETQQTQPQQPQPTTGGGNGNAQATTSGPVSDNEQQGLQCAQATENVAAFRTLGVSTSDGKTQAVVDEEEREAAANAHLCRLVDRVNVEMETATTLEGLRYSLSHTMGKFDVRIDEATAKAQTHGPQPQHDHHDHHQNRHHQQHELSQFAAELYALHSSLEVLKQLGPQQQATHGTRSSAEMRGSAEQQLRRKSSGGGSLRRQSSGVGLSASRRDGTMRSSGGSSSRNVRADAGVTVVRVVKGYEEPVQAYNLADRKEAIRQVNTNNRPATTAASAPIARPQQAATSGQSPPAALQRSGSWTYQNTTTASGGVSPYSSDFTRSPSGLPPLTATSSVQRTHRRRLSSSSSVIEEDIPMYSSVDFN